MFMTGMFRRMRETGEQALRPTLLGNERDARGDGAFRGESTESAGP